VTAAQRYEDLVCWQLADELRREVFALTATGQASKDFKFRDQIRDSASSPCRDIAEGFGRYWPADFSRFLNFARASLMETHDSARDGHLRGYFSLADCERLQRLAGRAGKATTGLIRYLDSCRDKPRGGSRPPRPPRTS
jgi:four helix bundle protein